LSLNSNVAVIRPHILNFWELRITLRTDPCEPNRPDTRITNPLSASNHQRSKANFFTLPLLCYNETSTENESRHLGQNEMAGLKGKSGPPGNMNAFKHGLAAIQKRREEGIPTDYEENVRQ